MTEAKKAKAKFRATKEWKVFRELMFKEFDGKDAITGRPLRKGWQLHHLDLNPDNYRVLNPNNFIPLNKKTHDIVHFLFRYDILKVMHTLMNVLLAMQRINEKGVTENEESKTSNRAKKRRKGIQKR